MSIIRVVSYQGNLTGHIPLEDLGTIKGLAPNFLVLPEHFFTNDAKNFMEVAQKAQECKDYLISISNELKCAVVGGTIIEENTGGFYNVCYLVENGALRGRYAKCCPTEYEQAQGILPGEEMKLFCIYGASIGILICSDVLDENNFNVMGELLADIIFVPAISPFKEETEKEKFERDEKIFVEGALHSRSYVVKTCGVGTIFGSPLQGRSLVAAPWGIIARVHPNEEHATRIMDAELDMEKIWAYQRSYTVR